VSVDTRLESSTRRVLDSNHRAPLKRIGPQGGPILVLVAWTVLLGGLLDGLHLLGRGTLAAPPLIHPALWGIWAVERGAPTAAFALLRCGAELTAAYLILTTIGGLVTRLTGLARATSLLDSLSVPVVKRMLGALASVSLASAPSIGSATEAAWAAPAALAAPAPAPTAENWSIPLMREVGAAAPPRPAPPRPTGPLDRVSAFASNPPIAASTWTVSPGDNLWAIAAATLTDRQRQAPTDAEVDAYWRRLIQANLTRLASPEAPELIFSGQVFVLPPS
jgi:hypothetical protein